MCQKGTSESNMQIQLRGEYYEMFMRCIHFPTYSLIHDSLLKIINESNNKVTITKMYASFFQRWFRRSGLTNMTNIFLK